MVPEGVLVVAPALDEFAIITVYLLQVHVDVRVYGKYMVCWPGITEQKGRTGSG